MGKKKSFKGGLDSLIEDSLGLSKKENKKEPAKKTKKPIEKKQEISDERLEYIEIQIKRLKDELWKWRTGELSIEKFHESLKEYGLKYNKETNEFELI